MEGLANYGSDDEATSSEGSPPHMKEISSDAENVPTNKNQPERDNFEDIGMDLSENESSPRTRKESVSPSHTPPSHSRNVTSTEKSDERKVVKDESRRSRSRSRGRRRSRRSRSTSSRSRSKSRSKSNSRRRDDDRRDKEKDKHREKYRKDRERERGGSSRSYNRRRSRSRSRSREKSSREPRRYRDSRDSRDSRDARDTRDTRRENRDFPAGRYSKRFDRACNKLAHLEKMGIDVNKSQEKKDANLSFYQTQQSAPQTQNFVPAGATAAGGAAEDKLLPPGVTGRLREQMERRKALWQKKPEVTNVQQDVQPAGANTSGKVWQATTFAHDQEGKQANKFKRLMGIRQTPAAAGDKSTDSLAKKQEELFSSMEQQYEVARTATHTMRGVGLGFGSYQR